MKSVLILWFVGIIIYFVLKSLIKKGGPAPRPVRKKGKYTPEEYHKIYTEGLREYEQKRIEQERLSYGTDGFKFFVDRPNIQNFTRVGMRVKLWTPKENPENVFIYQGDGPDGRLGSVPTEYANIIASHLIDALDYDAEIVELDLRTCKINCNLISKEKSKHRKEIDKEAKETIIKANALGKTNYDEAICLYRKAMEILREMDQQCENLFSTWRKQRFPINKLSLALEKQRKYKECLEEIEEYQNLTDKVGLYPDVA